MTPGDNDRLANLARIKAELDSAKEAMEAKQRGLYWPTILNSR